MFDTNILTATSKIVGGSRKSAIITLKGQIDSATAPLLKEKFVDLEKTTSLFILDFGGVNYIASAGWGVILSRIKQNRERGGDIVFTNMVKEVHSIYELLDLHRVTKYYPNVENAAKDLNISLLLEPVPETTMHADRGKKTEPARKTTIEDALRTIISIFPLSSAAQMKKIIQGPPYGINKVSTWKIYRVLRKLGLNTKEKRLYYAWQYEKRKKKE